MEESDSLRVLGSWVGTKEDVNMRLRRVGGLWAEVKEQLKNTRLSKRWQARIVQACVESALLFDCQARVWWKKDVMRLQKLIDWTDVGRLASDRSGWKKLVKERMDHLELDVYERQLAHGYVWGDGEERLVRNERRVNEDLRCRYEGCERLCRSRAGLVRHESVMHRRVEGRVRFAWGGTGSRAWTDGREQGVPRPPDGMVGGSHLEGASGYVNGWVLNGLQGGDSSGGGVGEPDWGSVREDGFN